MLLMQQQILSKYQPEINSLNNFSYYGASSSLSGSNGFCFNSDGSKIYVCRDGQIRQYSLSTNYDVTSTLTLDYTYVEPGFYQGIWINDTDDKLYVTINFISSIREIEMSTPNNLSTASTGDTTSFAYTGSDGFRSIQVVNNGYTVLMANGNANDGWSQFELTTPWSTSGGHTLIFQSTPRVPFDDTFIRAVQYSHSGACIIIAGTDTNIIVQKSLDSLFDSENYNEENNSSIDLSPYGSGNIKTCFMSPDNTKLYVYKDGTDLIYQFNFV